MQDFANKYYHCFIKQLLCEKPHPLLSILPNVNRFSKSIPPKQAPVQSPCYAFCAIWLLRRTLEIASCRKCPPKQKRLQSHNVCGFGFRAFISSSDLMEFYPFLTSPPEPTAWVMAAVSNLGFVFVWIRTLSPFLVFVFFPVETECLHFVLLLSNPLPCFHEPCMNQSLRLLSVRFLFLAPRFHATFSFRSLRTTWHDRLGWNFFLFLSPNQTPTPGLSFTLSLVRSLVAQHWPKLHSNTQRNIRSKIELVQPKTKAKLHTPP